MLATGINSRHTGRWWRPGPSPGRPRRLRCTAAYSSDALAAIKVAREEAIRQGSMFVSPQHLLVGLTAGASTAACALLQQQGITLDGLRQALDSGNVVPLSSSYLQARDTEFSPESRQLLNAAAQSGGPVVGTTQLLLQLLQQGGSEVQQLLQRLATALPQLQQQAAAAAAGEEEAAGQQPPPVEDQVARLVQDYKAYAATNKGADASSFKPSQRPQAQPAQRPQTGQPQEVPWVFTPEDDDIYN